MENRINQSEPNKQKNAAVCFLEDMLRGVAIGVAFIIPGFSGGSVAAILGIYEKLVGAIAEIFHNFKRSFSILLPILLGMLLGVAALILPIQWGISRFPIPTVTLFVGLAIGGLPSVTEKLKGKISLQNVIACVIPLAFAVALAFLPLGKEVDLFSLSAGGYLLLVIIGIVGSCALVVPGISGSMLLLIFGYYNPIVQLVTKQLLHGQNVGTCLIVLALLALGVVIGFFAISVLMKWLLKSYPRGTYFAILGFIVGSVPAVYASTIREAGEGALSSSPWYWVVAVLLLFVGAALSFLLYRYAKKQENNQNDEDTNENQREKTQ